MSQCPGCGVVYQDQAHSYHHHTDNPSHYATTVLLGATKAARRSFKAHHPTLRKEVAFIESNKENIPPKDDVSQDTQQDKSEKEGHDGSTH